MQDYATFLGSGNTALVAAVKAKLGSEKVTVDENAVKEMVAIAKAPSEVWTDGPTAA